MKNTSKFNLKCFLAELVYFTNTLSAYPMPATKRRTTDKVHPKEGHSPWPYAVLPQSVMPQQGIWMRPRGSTMWILLLQRRDLGCEGSSSSKIIVLLWFHCNCLIKLLYVNHLTSLFNRVNLILLFFIWHNCDSVEIVIVYIVICQILI